MSNDTNHECMYCAWGVHVWPMTGNAGHPPLAAAATPAQTPGGARAGMRDHQH